MFSSLLLPRLISTFVTVEEQLKEVLCPFGELVALGAPGEVLPLPGATRAYALDSDWKRMVSDQMRTARLVIVRVGGGREGLLWELNRAFELVDPRRLLILVLALKNKEYQQFGEDAERIFGSSLPTIHEIGSSTRSLSGFVRFSKQWESTFLPLDPTLGSRNIFKPLKPLFAQALQPVFDDLNHSVPGHR